MVKETTSRQLLISLVKRKIHKVYIKFTNDKAQRGNDELMKNFIEELLEFGIRIQENMEEHVFYNLLVGFKDETKIEDYMSLLVKYNKLF
jgi:hypothetical protein